LRKRFDGSLVPEEKAEGPLNCFRNCLVKKRRGESQVTEIAPIRHYLAVAPVKAVWHPVRK
jgi:hypothetical protein